MEINKKGNALSAFLKLLVLTIIISVISGALYLVILEVIEHYYELHTKIKLYKAANELSPEIINKAITLLKEPHGS